MPRGVVDRDAPVNPEQNNLNNRSGLNRNDPLNRDDQDIVVSRQPMDVEPMENDQPARQMIAAEPAPLPRERLSWGAIWTGVLSTFAIFFMLEFLVYAAGWSTLQVTSNGASAHGVPWVTGLVLLISFFVGSWLAASTLSKHGGHIGDLDGMLEGFMVWTLAVSLILAFAVFGAGNILGVVGSTVANGSTSGVNGTNLTDLAGNIRAGAWSGFIELIVTMIVCIAGGWLGGRTSFFDSVEKRFAPHNNDTTTSEPRRPSEV